MMKAANMTQSEQMCDFPAYTQVAQHLNGCENKQIDEITQTIYAHIKEYYDENHTNHIVGLRTLSRRCGIIPKRDTALYMRMLSVYGYTIAEMTGITPSDDMMSIVNMDVPDYDMTPDVDAEFPAKREVLEDMMLDTTDNVVVEQFIDTIYDTIACVYMEYRMIPVFGEFNKCYFNIDIVESPSVYGLAWYIYQTVVNMHYKITNSVHSFPRAREIE